MINYLLAFASLAAASRAQSEAGRMASAAVFGISINRIVQELDK